MTWNSLLKYLSTGRMPLVKRGEEVGIVTTIKNKGNTQGCAVDFGKGYDEWFHAKNTGDKRSKYMDELQLVID